MKSNPVVRTVRVWSAIAWGIGVALSAAVLAAAARNSPDKSRKLVVVGTGLPFIDMTEDAIADMIHTNLTSTMQFSWRQSMSLLR